MLRLPITYTDLDGEEQTDVFYFRLSEREIARYEARHGGNLEASLTRIFEAKDYESILDEFEDVILFSYGIKDDAKSFRKSEDIREAFKHHPAFDKLFMNIITNEEFAADFIMGVLPKEYGEALKNTDPSERGADKLKKLLDPSQPDPDIPTPPIPPRS